MSYESFRFEVSDGIAHLGETRAGAPSFVNRATTPLHSALSRMARMSAPVVVAMRAGPSRFLPRRVGTRAATDYFLRNRTWTAGEALDLGLATDVVPENELEDRARSLATELAPWPAPPAPRTAGAASSRPSPAGDPSSRDDDRSHTTPGGAP